MWLLVEASISLDEVIHDLVWRPSSVVRFDMASSFAPQTVHADRGNMFAYAMCNAGERSFVISWCCSDWMERVAGEKRESEKLAWSLKRGGGALQFCASIRAVAPLGRNRLVYV